MAGCLELRSRRGRLYYRPPGHSTPIDDSSPGYFRARSFRFSRLSADLRIPDPSTKRIWESLAGSTLAKSKDQAKRLLNYWSSPATESLSPILTRHDTSTKLVSGEAMTSVDGARRVVGRPSSTVGGPISGIIHRPSLVQDIRRDSATSISSNGSSPPTISSMGEERPIASGNGVSLSIALAEPVLFLQGMDQSELGNQTTTMLRGTFHLRVSKSAKIKTISLAFRGRAETEWPEGEALSSDI